MHPNHNICITVINWKAVFLKFGSVSLHLNRNLAILQHYNTIYHLFVILQRRVVQWNASCSPISSKKKMIVEVEVKSLTVWGRKLHFSLEVWQWILLYPLPDGSRVNWLWLGGCCLLVSLWAFCSLTSLMSLMLCSWVPMMFWVVWFTCCRAFTISFKYTNSKKPLLCICH